MQLSGNYNIGEGKDEGLAESGSVSDERVVKKVKIGRQRVNGQQS